MKPVRQTGKFYHSRSGFILRCPASELHRVEQGSVCACGWPNSHGGGRRGVLALVALFDSGNQQISLLRKVHGFLQVALLHCLVGLGQERVRILQSFAIGSRKVRMAKMPYPPFDCGFESVNVLLEGCLLLWTPERLKLGSLRDGGLCRFGRRLRLPAASGAARMVRCGCMRSAFNGR